MDRSLGSNRYDFSPLVSIDLGFGGEARNLEKAMAYKIFLLMKRKPGISVEAFREYYETKHVKLAMKHRAGDFRYIRHYLDPQPHVESGHNDELPYDVITELSYEDEGAYKRTLNYLTTSVMPDDVVADEMNLFDRPTMRIATVVDCETPMQPAKE